MVPAEDSDKATVAEKIGELVIRVLAEDLRPSTVITRESLENAIAASSNDKAREEIFNPPRVTARRGRKAHPPGG